MSGTYLIKTMSAIPSISLTNPENVDSEAPSPLKVRMRDGSADAKRAEVEARDGGHEAIDPLSEVGNAPCPSSAT